MTFEPGKELPVYEEKKRILEALETNSILICIGETGSGKTTQIPQYILNILKDYNQYSEERLEKTYGSNIWLRQLREHRRRTVSVCVTQPRRVAAVSVARRVAEEQHCQLGELVGYAIRFDDHTSRNTRLKYVTDGVLVRECLSDPSLSHYGCIILDEAHERSVHTDVMFALLKELTKRRSDLRVIVMSATLDKEKFSSYFNDAPVIEIPGRSHPVQVYHAKNNLSSIVARYIPKTVDCILRIHLLEPPGDILAFLTGQDEIEKACKLLKEKWEEEKSARIASNMNLSNEGLDLLILPMYGALPRHRQELIFRTAPRGSRKVVITTNIAETSITLDGIRFVVDPGLVKQKSYHPHKGIDELSVVPVSQSSALQRAGRAGRTADGKCYRLYTNEQFMKRPNETTPEIQRQSLTSTVLQLKALNVKDIVNFDFIDPPPADALQNALKELYWIEALDEDGKLTQLGKRLSRFPLEPSLARFIVEASRLECTEAALAIAALLSVEAVFYSRRHIEASLRRFGNSLSELEDVLRIHHSFYHKYGDHFTLLNVLNEYNSQPQGRQSRDRWCKENFIHERALRKANDIRKQLRISASQGGLSLNDKSEESRAGRIKLSDYTVDNIRRALCTGYYTKTAYALSRQGYKTTLNADDGSARIVFIDPSSCLSDVNTVDRGPAWVLYHELVATTKLHMRNVLAVEKKWVEKFLPRLESTDIIRLNGNTGIKRQEIGVNQTPLISISMGPETQQSVEANVEVKTAKASKDVVQSARERFLQRKREREKASQNKKQKKKRH